MGGHGFTGCGKLGYERVLGRARVYSCQYVLYFCHSEAASAPRNLLSRVFPQPIQPCRKTFSNTVIPSEASCFTVKHDAKSRDLLLLRTHQPRPFSQEREK